MCIYRIELLTFIQISKDTDLQRIEQDFRHG